MPVSVDSRYETITTVLTKEQVRRLRARQASLTTDVRRVTFSGVCREIVEAGLAQILRAPDMNLTTSTDQEAVA